jgi:hypothetical protein
MVASERCRCGHATGAADRTRWRTHLGRDGGTAGGLGCGAAPPSLLVERFSLHGPVRSRDCGRSRSPTLCRGCRGHTGGSHTDCAAGSHGAPTGRATCPRPATGRAEGSVAGHGPTVGSTCSRRRVHRIRDRALDVFTDAATAVARSGCSRLRRVPGPDDGHRTVTGSPPPPPRPRTALAAARRDIQLRSSEVDEAGWPRWTLSSCASARDDSVQRSLIAHPCVTLGLVLLRLATGGRSCTQIEASTICCSLWFVDGCVAIDDPANPPARAVLPAFADRRSIKCLCLRSNDTRFISGGAHYAPDSVPWILRLCRAEP